MVLLVTPQYLMLASVFIPMLFMIPVMLFNATNHLSASTVTEDEVWSNIIVSSDDNLIEYPFREGE